VEEAGWQTDRLPWCTIKRERAVGDPDVTQADRSTWKNDRLLRSGPVDRISIDRVQGGGGMPLRNFDHDLRAIGAQVDRAGLIPFRGRRRWRSAQERLVDRSISRHRRVARPIAVAAWQADPNRYCDT